MNHQTIEELENGKENLEKLACEVLERAKLDYKRYTKEVEAFLKSKRFEEFCGVMSTEPEVLAEGIRKNGTANSLKPRRPVWDLARKQELLDKGPDKFAEDNGYKHAGKLRAMYRELKDPELTRKKVVQKVKDKDSKKPIPDIPKQKPESQHPAIQALLDELPPTGRKISNSKVTKLSNYLIATLNLVYEVE